MTAPLIAAVLYAARSKQDAGDGNSSIESQVNEIQGRLASLGGRRVIGEPHHDYASGSKQNRGPGLKRAIDAVTAAADDHGAAELWVAHSTRLGRGTGEKGQARALGLLLYELRASGVTVRSVADDEFTTNEQLWGIASSQAAKYSQDLGAHVQRGKRQAAIDGRASCLFSGMKLGGYEAVREVDGNGRVSVRAIKHPEDGWIFETIWGMASEGRSIQAIELELSSRGAVTRPTQARFKPRPFDTNRIQQTLDNPRYAGLSVYNGEVVGKGQWPHYIEPEDFYRLREERRARSHADQRKGGRPSYAALLSGLAQCGVCGAGMRHEMHGKSGRPKRSRRYVCTDHRQHHRDSQHCCLARPVDAAAVDRVVLEGLEGLLVGAQDVREQLVAGRRLEKGRLETVASAARADAEAADNAVEVAHRQLATVLGDDGLQDAYASAAKIKQQDAASARTRLNAALDALSALEDTDDEDADLVLQRVWEALGDQVEAAAGDVRKLNVALREWFTAFEVQRQLGGSIHVTPVLSARAVDEVVRHPERWHQTGISIETEGFGGCDWARGPEPIRSNWLETANRFERARERGHDISVKYWPLETSGAGAGNSPLTSTKTITPGRWTIRSSSPHRVRWLRVSTV